MKPKKKTKISKIKNDPILKEWRDITYMCPVRGKVTQKVQVQVFQYYPITFSDSIEETEEFLKAVVLDDE